MKKNIFTTIISVGIGAGLGAILTRKIVERDVKTYKTLSDKYQALMLLLNQWIAGKQEGKSIVTYFQKNNYKTIAIYGMAHVGMRLYDEIKESGIDVRYVIDKNPDYVHTDLEVKTMEDILENVDVIVVTPIFYFDEIKRELQEKVECKIVSIEDILCEL